MTLPPIDDATVEAAAKALYESGRPPHYSGTEWDWQNIDRSYDRDDEDEETVADWLSGRYRADARTVLAAALPLIAPRVEADVRAKIAAEIEALRDRHFQQYGNEENGPRNYDWALTHAANIARTGDPLDAARVAGGEA